MTFWRGSGSGSADPCLWLMDPDLDPILFGIDPQEVNKIQILFKKKFSAYYFLKVHLRHFPKIKSQKKSHNSRNQSFSYNFCIMREGSGSGAESGSKPLTNGFRSGHGRSKNMWIQRIWKRIRIRICNTGTILFTSCYRVLQKYSCCKQR